MISHMTYVRCNLCGAPAPLADNAKEARDLAKGDGFRCTKGSDLCPSHRPDRPFHCGVQSSFLTGTGYFCPICGIDIKVSRNKA